MAKLMSIEALTLTTWRHGVPFELVRGVDLSIPAGAVTALLGASGSGKSLTCLGLLDSLPPGVARSSGRVSIDGVSRSGAELRGRLVATVMQNPRSAFNPILTMRAHAIETLKAAGSFGSDADTRILGAFDEVGLDEPARILAL